MKHKRQLAVILSLAMAAMSLAGCSTNQNAPTEAAQTTQKTETQPAEKTETQAEGTEKDSTEAAAQPADAAADVTYGVIVRSVDQYCAALAEGGEEVCKELGWKNITLNSDGDVQQQIDCIQSLVAQGVQGIYVHDLDAIAIAPALKKALDSGVYICTSSNLVPEMGEYSKNELLYYVQWDNEEAAYDLCKATIEKMGGEGKLLILTSQMGFTIVQQFLDGYHRAIAEYPGIEVVNEIDCNGDRAQALSNAEDALTANPDIDGIITMAEVMMWGVCEAVENVGIDYDNIVLATNDTSTQTMQMVVDGKIDVASGCPAKTGPINGAKILNQVLKGEDVTKAQGVEWVDAKEHLSKAEYIIYDISNADVSKCDY